MTSQSIPMEPVVTKAGRQPKREGTEGKSAGAMKAEALEPELKIPVAKAGSSVGNHSVVALIAAGKLPDSPRPRSARAMAKPRTDFTRECPMEAKAQTVMATA